MISAERFGRPAGVPTHRRPPIPFVFRGWACVAAHEKGHWHSAHLDGVSRMMYSLHLWDLRFHTGGGCPKRGTPQGARLGHRPSCVCGSSYQDPG